MKQPEEAPCSAGRGWGPHPGKTPSWDTIAKSITKRCLVHSLPPEPPMAPWLATGLSSKLLWARDSESGSEGVRSGCRKGRGQVGWVRLGAGGRRRGAERQARGALRGVVTFSPRSSPQTHVPQLSRLEQIGVGSGPERTHSWPWAGQPPAPLGRAFGT